MAHRDAVPAGHATSLLLLLERPSLAAMVTQAHRVFVRVGRSNGGGPSQQLFTWVPYHALSFRATSRDVNEAMRVQGHLIRVTIDLAKPWEQIEERLLGIISS